MSTKHRPYSGRSEAQSMADYGRDGTYTESAGSFRVAWDFHRREPRDLRDAVRMVRQAFSDEVPTKLHDGDELADDGTPRMTAKAEGYIFGSETGDDAARDAETGQRDLVGYYHTPFRATLANMGRGDECSRKRAAVVSHVSIGSQGPVEAAMAEGVPAWAAKVVAEDALRSFLRSMTDMKLHVEREANVA